MTNFDFIGKTKIWAALSGTIIIISIIALFARGINLSVEFTGGTSFNLIFAKKPTTTQIKDKLDKLGLDKSTVEASGADAVKITLAKPGKTPNGQTKQKKIIQQAFEDLYKTDDVKITKEGSKWGTVVVESTWKGSPTVPQVREKLAEFGLGKSIIQTVGKGEMLIRFSQKGMTAKEALKQQQDVQNKIEKSYSIKDINVDQVGPEWGEVITRAALIALILSLGSILIYISLRFEYKMAVSAIIALFHDIIITIGIYALVGRELSPATIAALLTIMGYSLYDTIVVFHKIVENSKNIQRDTYANMVNRSINQVLMRSINTSTTTILPILAVLIFGGVTLQDFAFALLIGLLTGAYSSIFVAAEILSFWKETEPRYANLKRKYA